MPVPSERNPDASSPGTLRNFIRPGHRSGPVRRHPLCSKTRSPYGRVQPKFGHGAPSPSVEMTGASIAAVILGTLAWATFKTASDGHRVDRIFRLLLSLLW